jgi:predicted DNA-binding transcriptional regulator YafY
VPLAPSSVTDTFEILFGEAKGALSSVLPRPERKADPNIIALFHQAIQSENSLHVRYTSMTTGASDGQWLAPTRFISDSERILLRAFSFKHEEFRNYLPIRIEPDSSFEENPLSEPLPEDVGWNTRAIIWLRPKSSLSEAQANVVRREFGFDGELLRVETRKSLEFFFDRRWGLAEKGARLERASTEYKLMDQASNREPPVPL